MLEYLFFALWFFLPAGVANAAPVFASKIPGLKKWSTPIDFYKKHNDKRILGNNKTWRGLCFGIFAAVITLLLQKYIFAISPWLQSQVSLIDYSNVNLLLGFALGFGALAGDAIESFFKRQVEIPSGDAWFPFDQIDYIIGGCLFSALVYSLPLLNYLVILIVWFFIHLISSYIGFLLKLKNKPI